MSPINAMESFATESTSKFEKFNGDNYASWSGYMRAVFLSKQCWEVVNVNGVPSFTSHEMKMEYQARTNVALGLLFLHMNSDYHHLIFEFDHTWEAWLKLKELYEGQQKAGRIYLKRQLFSLKMEEGSNVLDHCNKTMMLLSKLSSIGAKVEDEDAAICLLLSLPKSFENIVLHMEMNENELKLNDVIKVLTNEYVKRNANVNESVQNGSGKAFLWTLCGFASDPTRPRCNLGDSGSTHQDCTFSTYSYDL